MKAALSMNLEHLVFRHTRARSFYEKAKARLDFVARSEQEEFDTVREPYYRAFWNGVAEAYGASIESVGYDVLRIAKGEHYTFVREHEVMLDNHLSLNMMDNKPLTVLEPANRSHLATSLLGVRVMRRKPVA